MSNNRVLAAAILSSLVSLVPGVGPFSAPTQAQLIGHQPVHFEVSGPVQRLEMIVNTSRILTTEHNIPRLLVGNEAIVRAKPISPNQVQISAVKAGFTNLTVWDDKGQEHAIDVLVYGDARELENLLMTEFPDATLRVRPLSASVVISGYVPRAEMVSRIVRMAEDYYPSVINNVTVGGVQQILLHVKIMEVSRTKLRRMGFDWANFNANDSIIQNVGGLIDPTTYSMIPGAQIAEGMGVETLALGIVNGGNAFFGFLDALRQYNLVKVLAEPTLVTISGRPAVFQSGGEFPIIGPQSLGTVSIEYRQFGTRVDFVPIVLGNGRIRLEVRPQVSELDSTNSVTYGGTTVPGLRTRWVDTAVEMNAGQTLALAGLIQTQVESENRGIPFLADLPWIGAAFRRVEEQNNEIELLILVTPEFVDSLDPLEVPPYGPGQLTTSPQNTDLYFRGYLEVPKYPEDGSWSDCHDGSEPAGGRPVVQGIYQEKALEPEPSIDPVSATVGDRKYRSTSYDRSRSRRHASADDGADEPTLIGPIGYDVLE
ncbi:MAG: type II and III secretion system protein family protein [Pirellulaceae bacterium]